MRIIFLIFFLFISLFAQQKSIKIDSLNAILDSSFGKEKIEILIELASKMTIKNQEEGRDHLNNAFYIADSLNYKYGIAESQRILGVINWRQKKYNDALKNYYFALPIFIELNDSLHIAKTYNNIGLVKAKQKDNFAAVDNLFKALKIAQKIENKKLQARFLSNISIAYRNYPNPEKTIGYYLDLLKMQKGISSIKSMAITYNNIGLLYKDIGDYKQALDYLNKSIEFREKINDKRGISIVYNNIALTHVKLKDYVKAIIVHQKSIKLKKELNSDLGLGISYNNLGELFQKLRKFRKAKEYYLLSISHKEKTNKNCSKISSLNNLASLYMEIQDYNNAKSTLDKTLVIIPFCKNKKVRLSTYKFFAKYYSKINDYKSENDYLKKISSLEDSIYIADSEKKIAEIHSIYKLEKSETENKFLKKENELNELTIQNQQTLAIYLSIGFIIALVLISLIARKYKINKKLNSELEITLRKLKIANATKDKFFSIIAHDLKSPISVILGFSDLIIYDYEKMDHNERIHLLKEINKGTRQLYNHLDNLLEWSMSQKDKIVLIKKELQLKSIINKIIDNLSQMANNKNIKIINNTENNQIIYADERTIEIIFQNLLSNAIKFSSTDSRININSEKAGNKITVKITDFGVGISSDKLENLFDLTENESTEGTEGEKGTGLGLILCKEFTDKNGGEINVESEIDKGSTFKVSFPILP